MSDTDTHRYVIRPVIRPVVVCRDNTDGTFSWPVFGGWSVMRKPSDVPVAYRDAGCYSSIRVEPT